MKRIVKVAHGQYVPGDEVELPDGATYDELLFEPVPDSAEEAPVKEEEGDE